MKTIIFSQASYIAWISNFLYYILKFTVFRKCIFSPKFIVCIHMAERKIFVHIIFWLNNFFFGYVGQVGTMTI